MRNALKLALLAAPGLLYGFFVRPQLLKWGTRLGESQRRLEGDDVVPAPNYQSTHAIDIGAPPEAVWPWLAQMGRDATGWYSIDMLTNRGVPSAAYIRPDLPPPEAGMMTDAGLGILVLRPPEALVFGGFDVPLAGFVRGDMSLAYRLERRGEGARLLMRTRLFAYGAVGPWFNVLVYEWLECLDAVAQLRGIKRRAEATERPIEIALSRDGR